MKTKKIITILLFICSLAHAQSQTAEALVESKQKMDMTYKEMMQIMGKSANMVYEGIVLQNRQMVKEGALAISGHHAPNHKPWLIVEPSKQDAFKKMLLIYDEALHESAEKILEHVDKEDWHKTNEALSEMTQNCITCHQSWKDQVVKSDFSKMPLPLKKEEDHEHQIIPIQKPFQHQKENLPPLP